MSLLSELSATAKAVSAVVSDCVVAIGRTQRGAGTVIGPGVIVTNAHNLRDRTTQVTFSDGYTTQATATGVDLDHDLAVLATDAATASGPRHRTLTWSDTGAEVGDVVFAAGPNGRGTRVSMGLITTVGLSFRGPRGRSIHGSIEHSAPVARGSSGGPLVDAAGRLVALNSHRLGDGFTLAVPANAALRSIVDALSQGEVPERRRLGVAVASAEITRRLRRAVGLPDVAGLLVRGVEAGSPGERSGIREGDLLVAAAGTRLTDVDALIGVLGVPAATIEIRLLRSAEEMTVLAQFNT